MITLVTLPPAFGLRNVSPFCLKVEMALKHVGIDFDITSEADPRKTPKGKLPYLILDNGEKIPDSELILEHLDEISQGKLYGSLTPQEKAVGTAFVRMAEDHLYWLGVASRWLDDKWFPHVVSNFFGFVPGILRGFVSRQAQKQVEQTMHLHGLGRHTLEEQKAFARRDLQAIADQVMQNYHIVGGRLTVYDFAVASVLVGFMENQPETWLSEIANSYPSLKEYVKRIQGEVGVWARENPP